MNNFPEGNYYNKYDSNNLFVKYLMDNFHLNLDKLVVEVNPKTIYEVGCGEGYLANRYSKKGFIISGSDISKNCIDIANKTVLNAENNFKVCDIYKLSELNISKTDLVICCEVLEHLENPEKALEQIYALNSNNFIFSVPREPLWRFLNFIRGSYITSLGNTPGHLQHWSRTKFVKFISTKFKVEEVLSPLPWTMLRTTKL